MSTIELTQHIRERYAERIMGRENKTDIAVFINEHQEKIQTDIEKMITFGELLYSGRSTARYNEQLVDVYLKDTWIVIVDHAKNKAITLYSIDLGLGREFNLEYVAKLKNRLEEVKEKHRHQNEISTARMVEWDEEMRQNKAATDEYRILIKTLEEHNTLLADLIRSETDCLAVSEKGVRDVVAVFCGRKVF